MIKFHEQETKWTCGAACMKMILEACKIRKSEKLLVKLLSTNKVRGTWLRCFAQVAEKYKLNYIVQRDSTIRDLRDALENDYYILLAYYIPKEKIDHYAVVKKIDDEFIYFYDPYYGPKHKYKLTYFRKVWKTNPKHDTDKAWFIGVKR